MTGEAYLAACVEAAIGRCIALDAELGEEIVALEGAVLELHLQGIELGFRLRACAGRVAVEAFAGRPPGPPPASGFRMSAPPATLVRLLASGARFDGALPAGVSVSGDMRLAQRLQTLLRRADLDLEEPLAGVLGDTIAHELGRGARRLLAWTIDAADTLLLDAGEYLREERGAAPDAAETEDFALDVERLRDDVERLEQRIARLDARSARAARSAEP
ncbi:MAG: SCP2 sterol-binding domain-containing protein [Gammaproteobacteria bacterium]|nr:SCP2 sterol-binding domain-containing protein [Gammaproteobacteria bacterium]